MTSTRTKRPPRNVAWAPTLLALVVVRGAGWLGRAAAPAIAVVPGGNAPIAIASDRDGDFEI